MTTDENRQDHSKQTTHESRPIGTRPALTSHRPVMRADRQRVLVMHGDEEIRRLIAISLTLEGFDVTTAADVRDCLYKARAAGPGILITTNKNVPHPGECRAARLLRRYLDNSSIKVLLINSACESEEDWIVSTGIDGCLTAPFDPAEMIRMIRNELGAPEAGQARAKLAEAQGSSHRNQERSR